MMSQSSKGRCCMKQSMGDTYLLLHGPCISTAELNLSNFEVMLSDIVCKENDYFFHSVAYRLSDCKYIACFYV